MMTERQNTEWIDTSGHPSEDDLRLYVDGELEAREAALVKAHLEACWSCRVKLDEVQQTIADFIMYRNQVLRPLVGPPPQGWRGFESRLEQLAQPHGSRSRWWPVRQSLGRFLAGWRALSPALFETKERRHDLAPWSLTLAALSPSMVRATVVLILMIAATLVWFRFGPEPVVTATELLERATEAQTRKILSTSQPVIHQRIQVRRKRGPRAAEETARLETWNDLNHSRFNQFGDGAQIKSGATSDMLDSLEQIFQANHLDWRRPLSAVSFAEWRKSLSAKTEEVRRFRLADGVEALGLRTVSTGPLPLGAVIEATLTVRARDWHPFKQVLKVKEEAGEAEYELVETQFEVVSLAAVDPAVFAESPALSLATTAPMVAPSPELRERPAIIAAPTAASVSLEIEALALLSQAGADLGEQVSVERTPEGALSIKGLVETEERKLELRQALRPVLISPAVRFEVETVEEALRRSQPAVSSPPAIVMQRATTASTLPVEEELRRYLSGQGRFTDEQLKDEMHRLARRLVNASFSIRQRAQALKRLSERFTPEEWPSLDEASRARLLSLIESHAAAAREQSQELRRSLQAIFNSAVAPLASLAPFALTEIVSVSDLIRAINQLVEMSATSDRAIQAALTLSTEGAPTLAIKTPAFRSALAGLEQIAGQIQAGVSKLTSVLPDRKQ